jgi:hypothetical protein
MLILIIVLTIINVAILWHYNKAQLMLNVNLLYLYAKCIHDQFHIFIRSMECEINEMKWNEITHLKQTASTVRADTAHNLKTWKTTVFRGRAVV